MSTTWRVASSGGGGCEPCDLWAAPRNKVLIRLKMATIVRMYRDFARASRAPFDCVWGVDEWACVRVWLTAAAEHGACTASPLSLAYVRRVSPCCSCWGCTPNKPATAPSSAQCVCVCVCVCVCSVWGVGYRLLPALRALDSLLHRTRHCPTREQLLTPWPHLWVEYQAGPEMTSMLQNDLPKLVVTLVALVPGTSSGGFEVHDSSELAYL